MADRYLLESGSPDGYLLEDGTGVLLQEPPDPFVVTARHSGTTSTTSAANLVTGSTTPTASSLLLVAYGIEMDAFGTLNLPVFTSPVYDAATFTVVDKDGDTGSGYLWGSTNGFWVGGAVYRASLGASPTAGTVTVDASASNGFYSAVCFDITGHNVASPIVQTKHAGGVINPEASGQTGTITFDSPVTAGNKIVVCWFSGADGGGGFASPTAGTLKTFTALSNNQNTASLQTGAFHRTADGGESQTITCTNLGGSSGAWTAVAFEIAVASSGSNVTALPTGISSAEAFGTTVAAQILTTLPTGIATEEAFGATVAVLPITAQPTGITSGEAFGVTVAAVGAAAQPSGIPSAEAFGTTAAVLTLTVSPSGIASAEAFGALTATAVLTASPSGIASAEAFGTTVAVKTLVAIPSGIASAEAFGTTVSAPPLPYLTSVSADGRYFKDQFGNPMLVRGESPWAMFTKLSSSEMDTYLGNRATYDCNLMLVSMIGAVANGAPADTGATYDGVLPFTGGNPTTFNSTYWARMDSYVAKARDLGITLMIYPMDGWNTVFSSVVFNPGSISNAQCQTYGQTLATRYASYPNIIWAFGGDYNEDATINARFNACLTGIRAAGDTRLVTVQLLYEKSLSDDSTFWEPKVDFNFVYTYYVTYKAVKDGYDHTWSGAPTIRPSLFSEGAYENSFGPHDGTDENLRRQACWALTSGSPGDLTGQEGVWNFQSGWASLLNTDAADQIKAIRDTFEPLKWWTLVPDDSNLLVTAGRGTRITTDSATFPAGNTFVTAARAADGSVAVVYLPNAASAVTVDMTKIGSSPVGKWVDPTTGAQTTATIGSSYSHAGANAAGDSDWLLLLTGASVIVAVPTGIASGEVFGTTVAVLPRTSLPTGIASAEVFGVPTALVAQQASATGIPTAEAFGSTTAVLPITSAPTGIPTAEAFGAAVAVLTLTGSLTGITSAEAFGTTTAVKTLTSAPAGIASAEAFGAPVAVLPITAQPSGISSAEAFGAATAATGYVAQPTSIVTAEAFGTTTVIMPIASSATGIPTAEAFGTTTAVLTLTVSSAGIPSAEAFGVPTALSAQGSQPTGIPSAEAFGTPTAVIPITAQPTGIPSAEAFGTPFSGTLITVSPTGIASEEAFGVITAQSILVVTPNGIISGELFGTTTAITDSTPVAIGIPSAEAFGVTRAVVGALRNITVTVVLEPTGVDNRFSIEIEDNVFELVVEEV